MSACMWLGRGVIKGTARMFHLLSIRENVNNSLPLAKKNGPHTIEELAALDSDSGLDFEGRGQ